MELLLSEVSVLLKMLDQEILSSSTQEKKTSVLKLLQQMQPSGQDRGVSVFLEAFSHIVQMEKILILGL